MLNIKGRFNKNVETSSLTVINNQHVRKIVLQKFKFQKYDMKVAKDISKFIIATSGRTASIPT